MSKSREIYCYRSGPIERDPANSFHAKNRLDAAFHAMGIKIIGDTFDILNAHGRPQNVYGPGLKKLRNQGLFEAYNHYEFLTTPSFRSVRKATFMVSRPSSEASGGTVSETVITYLRAIPKLVIVGPHHESIIDNNSTFMIRMLTDRCSLLFNTEKEVEDFVRKHFEIFRQGRRAVRELILAIKRANPFVNNRPKPLYDDKFEGKTAIIFGMPGCGKSTQSRTLQDLAGFKYFGSGHELRRLSSKYQVLGENLGKGKLAPDIVIHYLLSDFLMKLEKFEPAVLDGSPKKLNEAHCLMDLLELLKRKPQVIVIEIDEDLSRERIKLRGNCNACETSFCGWEFIMDPVCPKCLGPLVVRPENSNDDAINEIMGWYKTDVETVIEFFAEKGLVSYVDGHRSKESIFQDILEILKEGNN